jgi:serine/threonine-protein kinase
LRRERGADWVPFAWSSVDVLLLTALLYLTGSQASPLVVGYPFLVAASGLWFRVRLVWFTTAVAAAVYAILVVTMHREGRTLPLPHYHVIFLVALAVLGFVTAYQVQRIRVLSRYYEHRPLP